MTLVDTDMDDLSRELTRLVRQVQGVTAVYASQPLVTSVIVTIVDQVRSEALGARLVSTAYRDSGIDVSATIGVGDDEPAGEVCRRVSRALRDHVARRSGMQPGTVRVTVGSVG